MELKQVKREVIYKVGRNVLMFQQLENMLKYLVANASVSGRPGELASKSKKRADSVMKQTLGMVAGEYLDPAEPSPSPEGLNKPHFTFSFRVDYFTNKKEVIESLVAERNHLVHHFLLDIDDESVENWTEAGERLEVQCEKLEAEIVELRQVIGVKHDLRRDAVDYIKSDEFKDSLLR